MLVDGTIEVARYECQPHNQFDEGIQFHTSLLGLFTCSCALRYALGCALRRGSRCFGYHRRGTCSKPIVDPCLYFTIYCSSNRLRTTIKSVKTCGGVVIIPRDKLSINSSMNLIALLIASPSMFINMLKMATASSGRSLTFFFASGSARCICCELLQLKGP